MANPPHFGDRLKRARAGLMNQEKLADISGISVSTVKRIEKNGSAKAAQKKGLALVLVEAGANATHFAEELGGLLTPSELENVSLRRDVDQLRSLVRSLVQLTTADPSDEARQLLEDELSVALKWSSSDSRSEAQGNAARNG